MFFLIGIAGALAVGSFVFLPTSDDSSDDDDVTDSSQKGEEGASDESAGDLLADIKLSPDTGGSEEAAPSIDTSGSLPVTEEIRGTELDDSISGEGQRDTILGFGGDDTIMGHGGDDIISGGVGDDFLAGGTGQDALHGQSGNDTLFGSSGQDTLFGGGGDDFLQGSNSNDHQTDFLNGGFGNDTLSLAGGDKAFGGQGEDVFSVIHQGGEPVELLDFDPVEDQLIIESSSHQQGQEPVVEVRLNTLDESVAEIVLDGEVIALMPASTAPTVEQVSIVATD